MIEKINAIFEKYEWLFAAILIQMIICIYIVNGWMGITCFTIFSLFIQPTFYRFLNEQYLNLYVIIFKIKRKIYDKRRNFKKDER